MHSKRLFSLDFLKIFAILWICLYHFLDFRSGWKLGSLFDSGELVSYFANDGIWLAIPKLILSMGGVGVHIFIIASGLGLALSAGKKRLKFVDFFKKRLLKILPHYWILLIGLLLIKIFQGNIINYWDWLTHFLGIHTFFPSFTYSISTPLWFIGVIIQLYLLFPILWTVVIPRKAESDEESHRLSCKQKRDFSMLAGMTRGVAIVLIIIAVQVLLNKFFVQLFDGGRFFTEFILSFCIGIYLGNLINTGKITFGLPKSILLITTGIVGMAVLLFKAKLQILTDLIGLVFSLVSIFIFIGIFLACHPEFNSGSIRLQTKGFLQQGRNDKGEIENDTIKKFLIFLSSLSYSLYLTHYFILTHILSKFTSLSWVVELLIFFLGSFGLSLLLDYLVKGFVLLFNIFLKHEKNIV